MCSQVSLRVLAIIIILICKFLGKHSFAFFKTVFCFLQASRGSEFSFKNSHGNTTSFFQEKLFYSVEATQRLSPAFVDNVRGLLVKDDVKLPLTLVNLIKIRITNCLHLLKAFKTRVTSAFLINDGCFGFRDLNAFDLMVKQHAMSLCHELRSIMIEEPPRPSRPG